jgi:hypothetical protein
VKVFQAGKAIRVGFLSTLGPFLREQNPSDISILIIVIKNHGVSDTTSCLTAILLAIGGEDLPE